MRKTESKCKKRRIDWRQVLFHLHRPELSEAYTLFRVGHPNMSINRCAYYVLKTYYSTTSMRCWRECYEQFDIDYETLFNLRKVDVYGV